MNKMTKKKDFKLLITFFSIELLVLIVCFAIAHMKTNGPFSIKAASAKYESYLSSMDNVNSNVLDKTFGGDGVEGFTRFMNYDNEDTSMSSTNVLYKYYSFNLSDSGITSNMTKAAPGAQMNGLLSNTATNTVVQASKSTFTLGKFKIMNDYVPESLDLVKILEKPLVIEPMDKSNILIYHVHATEGYSISEADKSDMKTSAKQGEENNVVSVGNILQNEITAKSGIKVLHDKTVFKEGMQSIIAYNNAAEKLKEIYAQNKVKLQIDLHRNSASLEGKKYDPTVNANGVNYAPISFVVALDWDAATGDRAESVNPYWKDNFKLCFLVMEKLEEKVPGIVRQIDLRRTPYNQGFVENSLLVEIGFDGNLTSEAEATARLFGDVLSDIYG